MESFLHYFLTIFPFFLILFFGILFVVFVFNFFEKKRTKIWDKKTKNLLKEARIKSDKELHEKMILKKSYINSVDRLGKFLFNIYKNDKKIFKLTPLDAMLLILRFFFCKNIPLNRKAKPFGLGK